MHQFLKFILGKKLYMFRTVPLSIIKCSSLYTQQWCQSHRFADSLRAGSRMELSSILILLASSQHNLYDIYLLLCIQYQTPDEGQKTCPKHVEFYSKNKFEKLVHFVGFIIRIYYDTRSSECQTPHLASRLKKEYSYTSTPPLGLHGLLEWKLYLFFSLLQKALRQLCLRC